VTVVDPQTANTPLVGLGAVAQSTSTNNCLPAWAAACTRAAGNLLVCWGANTVNQPVSFTTGWTSVAQAGTWFNAIWYKVAAGGDASPTLFNPGTPMTMWAALAEFQASGTVALDQKNTVNAGTVSSFTLANPAADAAPGDLIVSLLLSLCATAQTVGICETYNNGAGPAQGTGTQSVSSTSHRNFMWGQTASNAAPTSVLFNNYGTPSSGSCAGILLTFKGILVPVTTQVGMTVV
jgi:hypothetical protein